MRTWLQRLVAAAAWLAVAAAVLLALALQRSPSVPPRADVAPQDVDRALAFARQHDPRRLPPGQLRHAWVQERDADLLLHHALQRLLPAAARVALQPGGARVQASVALPLRWPLWVNLDVQLRQGPALPEVDALRVGRLPLPASWLLPLLQRAAAWRGVPPEALSVADFVRKVQFGRGSAIVTYAYTADARERMLGALLPAAQRGRVRAYAALLARLGEPAPEDGSISLAALLPPLFALAAERSATADADAAAENRAAIVALVLYTNRRALDMVMPQALDGLPARPLRVTLAGRDDFPRHFLISAAVAADSGTPLADAVGLWKEIDDSRHGSGFSFNDLAADRAGTRFGERAVRDPARLQARMAAGLAEADVMPPVADLPEFLTAAELQSRFGGVGGPEYRRLMADVEARVAALPVLR